MTNESFAAIRRFIAEEKLTLKHPQWGAWTASTVLRFCKRANLGDCSKAKGLYSVNSWPLLRAHLRSEIELAVRKETFHALLVGIWLVNVRTELIAAHARLGSDRLVFLHRDLRASRSDIAEILDAAPVDVAREVCALPKQLLDADRMSLDMSEGLRFAEALGVAGLDLEDVSNQGFSNEIARKARQALLHARREHRLDLAALDTFIDDHIKSHAKQRRVNEARSRRYEARMRRAT